MKTFNLMGQTITQKQFYGMITEIYSILDEIIEELQNPNNEEPELQFKITEPYINEVKESADVITEFYAKYIKNGSTPTPNLVKNIESAIRNITLATIKIAEDAEKQLLN